MGALPVLRFAMLPLGCFLFLGSVLWSEPQPAREYSYSAAEAKRRRTFVAEIEMVPSVVKWKGQAITLKNGWIEKSKGGGCYLCFHLKEGRDLFVAVDSPIMVLENEQASVTMHVGRGWTQVVQYLESEDISKARFSLIERWKDKRPKDIFFVRKK